MNRLAAPTCPRCGCPDSARVRESRFGRITEHCKCAHCGKTWRRSLSASATISVEVEVRPLPIITNRADTDAPVLLPNRAVAEARPPVPEPWEPSKRCPECGEKTRVTSTRAKVRYHACTACPCRFKTPRAAAELN